jgi:hypothetical protein
MKTGIQHRSPFEAWLATLPLALGLPAVVWLIIEWKLFQREWPWGLIIYGIMILVHLGAYMVAGLPIFLNFYGHANSPIWAPVIGISSGAVLGVCALFVVYVILGGYSHSALLALNLYLIGAGYGTATAIAALRQRPTSV